MRMYTFKIFDECEIKNTYNKNTYNKNKEVKKENPLKALCINDDYATTKDKIYNVKSRWCDIITITKDNGLTRGINEKDFILSTTKDTKLYINRVLKVIQAVESENVLTKEVEKNLMDAINNINKLENEYRLKEERRLIVNEL